MRLFLRIFTLTFLSIPLNVYACKTEAAVVLVGQAKESISVEAENVEFSVVHGTKLESELDLKFVPKAHETPGIPPAPGGLSIFTLVRGPSLQDGTEGEIIATQPNKKIVTIHLKLKPRTKSRGCGSHEIEYN